MQKTKSTYTSSLLQKIVRTVARQYNISVRKGSRWQSDVKNKVLYYTDDVSRLSPFDGLTLLVHEVAHLAHSTPPRVELSQEKYAKHLHELTNVVEDIRVDAKIIDDYGNGVLIKNNLHDMGAISALGTLYAFVENFKASKQEIDKLNNGIRETRELLRRFHISPEAQQLLGVGTSSICGIYRELHQKRREVARLRKEGVNDQMLPIAGIMILLKYHGQWYAENPFVQWHERTKGYNVMTHFAIHHRHLDDITDHVAEQLWHDNVEGLQDTTKVADYCQTHLLPMFKKYKTLGDNRNVPIEIVLNRDGGYSNQLEGTEPRSVIRAVEAYRTNETAGNVPSGGLPKRDDPIKQLEQKDVGTAMGVSLKSPSRGYEFNYAQTKKGIRSHISKQTTLLLKSLIENNYTRYAGKYRSGRISKKRLYTIANHDYKVFDRKKNVKSYDYAISLLVDVSSSMSRDYKTVYRMCAIFDSVLEKADGVAYMVMLFSNNFGTAKDFASSAVTGRKFDDVFHAVSGGGTDILNPFRLSLQRLSQVRQRKKILITITDGEFNGRQEDTVRELMNDTKKNITYYGIGIQSDVSRIFGNAVRVKTAHQALEELAGIMHKTLRS